MPHPYRTPERPKEPKPEKRKKTRLEKLHIAQAKLTCWMVLVASTFFYLGMPISFAITVGAWVGQILLLQIAKETIR